jgi:hypothetical protein
VTVRFAILVLALLASVCYVRSVAAAAAAVVWFLLICLWMVLRLVWLHVAEEMVAAVSLLQLRLLRRRLLAVLLPGRHRVQAHPKIQSLSLRAMVANRCRIRQSGSAMIVSLLDFPFLEPLRHSHCWVAVLVLALSD